MIISDTAIRKPVVTIVAMIALVLFGVFALVNSEVDEFPTIANPTISISVSYPGATPSQVERDVVDKIEEKVNAISGLEQISSQSVDGFASITVQFVFGKSVDRAMQEVRDAISEIRNDLPSGMDEPVLRRFDPASQPVVTLLLMSERRSAAQLAALADPGITRELRGLNGVAEVTLSGAVTRAIEVRVRPADLQAAGVSIGAVVSAIEAQNLSMPAGRVNTSTQERTIRFQGRLSDPAAFEQLVVTQKQGRVVRLRDLADISDGTEEQRTMAYFNGVPGVGIEVKKATESSTTSVTDAVVARVRAIQQRLPRDVKLEVVKNSGDGVHRSVRNVEETLLEGAILTILTVFLFLNSWRSTLITGLALPVSVIAAFIPIWCFGMTLNTMSLLGISLAIGILIDDAIVVRENIVRHVEMGLDRVTAAHQGTSQIGLAVAATTFSIVAVFVPIGFMGGMHGQMFKPFALTVAAAVLVSLFVSFSLDPMLSAYWPDPQHEDPGARLRRRGPMSRIADHFNVWFDRQTERYGRAIAWALDHRWAMIALASGSFVLALVLQVTLGGTGFVPTSDRSEINVSVETPPGSGFEFTTAKAREVERIVRRHAEVAYAYTSVGATSGSGEVTEASLYVKLVPKAKRRRSQQVISEQIRREVSTLAGANVYVYGESFGGNEKMVQVQVRGSDSEALRQAAARIQAAMRKVPGAVDVGLSTRGDRPEITVEVDRDMAGSLGLTARDVSGALQPAFAGVEAGSWVDPNGKTRNVIVRFTPSARTNAMDLAREPLVIGGATTGDGSAATAPLAQVARITPSIGPARIDHLDRDQVITVGANVNGRPFGSVARDVSAAVAGISLPVGITLGEGGMGKHQTELFMGIFAALGLALLLMYLILAIQFESFLDPLAIMLALPLSLIGVVAALLLTHDTLNLMSLIGIILLMGLVAKNAILLIDFAKWEHARGTPMRDALIQAGRVRLRPIMMTTVALIAGMTPVALGLGEGADFRAPLGRAVIGGVIASTALTLLVIPTAYEIMHDWLRRIRRPKASPANAPGAATAAGDADGQ
jgi:hydrophobic/amphiphilic exporter-1 (mainly G- bacteria), HAE1 family